MVRMITVAKLTRSIDRIALGGVTQILFGTLCSKNNAIIELRDANPVEWIYAGSEIFKENSQLWGWSESGGRRFFQERTTFGKGSSFEDSKMEVQAVVVMQLRKRLLNGFCSTLDLFGSYWSILGNCCRLYEGRRQNYAMKLSILFYFIEQNLAGDFLGALGKLLCQLLERWFAVVKNEKLIHEKSFLYSSSRAIGQAICAIEIQQKKQERKNHCVCKERSDAWDFDILTTKSLVLSRAERLIIQYEWWIENFAVSVHLSWRVCKFLNRSAARCKLLKVKHVGRYNL